MATMEQPITRSDLRNELRHYATRADIAEVRGELKAIRWTMGIVGVGLSLLIVALRFLDTS